MKLPPDDYYEDRPVRHAAQGDFYAGVPTPIYIGKAPDRARGARKRPLKFLRVDPIVEGMHAPEQPLVVVCNYTCGFVAQPPGTVGYSHHLRQVAPVVPIAELIDRRGMERTEARKLLDGGFLAGLLYVPRPHGVAAPSGVAFDDEFTDLDYAVLLYAMTTVHQSALDDSTRVARMSMDGQKRLIAGLVAAFGPSLYDPDDLEDPDMTCSWT